VIIGLFTPGSLGIANVEACCGFLDNGAELFATPIVERNQDLICDTHEVNGEDIPGNIIDSDLISINVQTTQLRTLFLS
jgi:hypothetical protein